MAKNINKEIFKLKKINKKAFFYTIVIMLFGISTIVTMGLKIDPTYKLIFTAIGTLTTWELVAIPCLIVSLKNKEQSKENKFLWFLYTILPLVMAIYIIIINI